ncbi:hypothetical protein GCM10010389_14430 [Streptomyces echinoruber]|uniref:Uncharacterized protein n=1 Tax=Streptomyces echinoruber TaxID=68898 RepID=A0A918QZS2_9ACTN|nr:hypothetical protein GCM10010389_14430 [Streptomyces echinoruber]
MRDEPSNFPRRRAPPKREVRAIYRGVAAFRPRVKFTEYQRSRARAGDKWDLPCQATGPMDRVPNQ